MFHVYFLKAFCQKSTTDRAILYDRFWGQPDPEDIGPNGTNEPSSDELSTDTLPPFSYTHFQKHVIYILSVNAWQRFFKFIGVCCPSTKEGLARLLRNDVKNSRRKWYHKAGMDFSRVHASGTSKILAKGQQYSTSSELRRVVFTDRWGFQGNNTVYLDATCLLYSGNTLTHTVDYRNRSGPAESHDVQHSGDAMHPGGGTRTIQLDLQLLEVNITSCVFVISTWKDAKLSDIVSPSISFMDEEGDGEPLCTYDLDTHDKISH